MLVRLGLLGFGGSYALSAVIVALLALGLPAVTGLSRADAAMLSAVLGFLVHLALIIWTFAERRLARVWILNAIGLLGALWLAGAA